MFIANENPSTSIKRTIAGSASDMAGTSHPHFEPPTASEANRAMAHVASYLMR